VSFDEPFVDEPLYRTAVLHAAQSSAAAALGSSASMERSIAVTLNMGLPLDVRPCNGAVAVRVPLALSNRALDLRAAVFTDVSHLDQTIGELDSLARLRSHRPVFLRHHSATAAGTDHEWLFWARSHG
jgi:hypothetical protein